MKKSTKLSRLKIRWLNTRGLILMLFGFLFLSWGGNAQTTVTIGTGTSSNGATAYPAIFGSYYYGNKIQILYEASELLAGGATANSYINSVAFDVDNLNSVPTLVNFTVKVYTTSETNPLGTTAFFDGVNTTNSIGSYTVAATGWNTLTLTNPILWNGCDNIVVEVCSNDSTWTSNGNASTKYSSVSGSNTYVRWYRADTTTVCPATTGPDTSTNRPNIQFSLATNTANCGYVCDFESVVQSATTVDLSWTGTGVSYEIEYGVEGFTPGTGTTITTTNLTQTLNTLSASTTYDFYIEQICSSGPSAGAYGPIKITTPCDVVSNNFSENFDTTPSGANSQAGANWPACWSQVDEVVTTGYANVSTTDPLSAPHSYRMYRTNSVGNQGQNLILISPETNNLGNGTKQLRFYARAGLASNINQLEIVRANGNDATATFTVIQTFTIDHLTYEEYIVPLPVTSDDYFGFRLAHHGGTAASTVLLDDVFYEDLDTCIPPTDITITNIGQTTADISWTASATPGATQYEYEVRTLGDPGSGTAGLDATGIVTGLTANVTGLSPSLKYSVYVRSICGTTSGRWNHIPEIFNTLCGIVTSNFYENFDTVDTGSTTNPTVPNCWTYIRDSSVTTLYGYTTATAGQTGKGFYTYRSAAGDGDLYLISPETNNLGSGTKQLRFSVRVSSASYATTQKFEVYTMDGNTATANKTLIQGNIPLEVGWQEFIVPLPNTTDDYFMFSFERDGGLCYVYLDNVYYEDLSPCIFPLNIDITNITETTATISWDTSLTTGVTGYEYEVRTEGAPGSGSTGLDASGSVTGTTASVTGLTGATEYVVYVRSVCGASQGVWTTFPVSFITACPVYTDFYENFDSTPTGSSTNLTVPICWTSIDEVALTGYNYVSSTYSASPGRSYYMYRTNNTGNSAENLYLISPETDTLGNGSKRLRFKVRATSTTTNVNKLEILRGDGITATSNFTVIETIHPNQTTFVEYIVNLPVTTDKYFAFRLAYNGLTSASTIYIDDIYYEDIPAPSIDTITFVDNTCFGDTSGSATVVVNDGVLPLTYEWLPPVSTSDTATDLAAGIYTVTVTDALSRSVTDTITISQPDELLLDLQYSNVSCNGQTDGWASVNPSGGVGPYSVLWSTNDTTDTISNLIAGTYTVTITDANDCEITEDFDIIEPDVLTASVSAQNDVTVSGGNDGSATITATGGTAPYTYSWSPSGGTSDTATGLTAGTYTVDITDDSGCTTDVTVVITEPMPLTITLVSQTNVSCNGGNDGEIIIDVVGDHPPFTYLWSPATGNSSTVSNLIAGTYTVTVTDTLGAFETATYTIDEPTAISLSVGAITNVTCNGGSNGSATAAVSGGTPPYTYTWSSGETSAAATNLTVGNNFVRVTDANGCELQQSFTIDQPTPIVITLVNLTDASCNGQADGAISISVNGGISPYTYNWSNGQSTSNMSNLPGGNYIVTVTDANGCTKTETYTVVEPAYVFPPSATNQGFCSDNNPTLSDVVVNGSNIQWYDAATGGNALPMTTTLANGVTYYASQTIGGCESSSRAAVQVSLSQSVPLITASIDVCYNSRVQDVIIDGFNYNELKWYSSATSTTTLAPTTLLTTGTYYISSFTNDACESAKRAVQITVLSRVVAPIVTPQSICGSGHTLDDLTIGQTAGTTLIWYASAQATTPLPGTTQALSGTYYVEQKMGSCTSVRVAVPVQVIPVTSPAMTDIITCSGTTIADFNAQVAPTKYVWYINNTTTTPLAETTLISSGTFYIAEEVSGCISNRAQVDVVVNQRPNSPTGQTVQRVDPGSTVADLQMNQPGAVWFGSEADALAFTKQLPSNTPLVHNKKYYAVLVGGNNCASLPTEVEVIIVLSTNNLDLTYLKYYPNPTDAELNISYVEAITKVEIFNIAGQKVLSKEFDANEVKVDLSGFGAGTYMVRIETETASQFVKVVKK